jgi:hypothetical protein
MQALSRAWLAAEIVDPDPVISLQTLAAEWADEDAALAAAAGSSSIFYTASRSI